MDDLNDFKVTGIYTLPKQKGQMTTEYYCLPHPPYISVKTAAKMLGMSASRLSVLCSQGAGPAAKVGSSYLLPREWAEAEGERRAHSMTQAEAARALGVTRQYIGQLVAEGKLALVDGRIPKSEVERQKEVRTA